MFIRGHIICYGWAFCEATCCIAFLTFLYVPHNDTQRAPVHACILCSPDFFTCYIHDRSLPAGHQFNRSTTAAEACSTQTPSSTYSKQQQNLQVQAEQPTQPQQAYSHSTRPVESSLQAPDPSGPTVVLPQMQEEDLQSVQQAEQKPFDHKASVHASAMLRDTVKQTVAAATHANDGNLHLPDSSSPTTATLAVQLPAETSPEGVKALTNAVAGDSASCVDQLGLPDTAEAEPSSPTASTSAGAAFPQTPTDDVASSSRDAAMSTSGQVAEAGSSPTVPANLSILHFARQSEVERLRRRPKLESFDKMIGNPANTPHHISLQAAPEAHKPYLPQWLASPLGMHATHRTPAPGQAPAPPAASASASRLTTEDTEVGHSQHGARNVTTLGLAPLQRQQLQQPDPHDLPQTPVQPDGSANPFASLSQAAFSPPSKPLMQRHLKRATSEASMRKSTSSASLSPANRLQSSGSLEVCKPEDSFVSLQLQTVRPTAPRPFSKQASQSFAQTPQLRPPSRGSSQHPPAKSYVL